MTLLRQCVHLTTFHGVFAPHANGRAAIVPRSPDPAPRPMAHPQAPAPAQPPEPLEAGVRERRLSWAALLQRIFAIDVFVCTGCGGRRKIIAAITQPDVAAAILSSLDLAPSPRLLPAARPPPRRQLEFEQSSSDDDYIDPPFIAD